MFLGKIDGEFVEDFTGVACECAEELLEVGGESRRC